MLLGSEESFVDSNSVEKYIKCLKMGLELDLTATFFIFCSTKLFLQKSLLLLQTSVHFAVHSKETRGHLISSIVSCKSFLLLVWIATILGSHPHGTKVDSTTGTKSGLKSSISEPLGNVFQCFCLWNDPL